MEKRIYFHDTDAGGVVYYGKYLEYLEEARTEFLEKKGLSVAAFKMRGYMYAVSHCSIHYRSPAQYAETLVCTAELKKVTAVRLIFDQKIFEKQSRRLVAEAEVTLVCLNDQFKPVQMPSDLKGK